MYRGKIFNEIDLKSTGAQIDAEVLARAMKKGYTITQTGVRHHPRASGIATGASFAVMLRTLTEPIKLYTEIVMPPPRRSNIDPTSD